MNIKESKKVLFKDEEEIRNLAQRYNIPYIDLAAHSLSRELIQSIPVDFLYRFNFVPLEENGDVVKIAISDPS